jgi:uncharacterized protein YjbJ (UPF0337 family)
MDSKHCSSISNLRNSTTDQSTNQTKITNQSIKMSDKNTSTLQSYIDSASGAVQTVLGNITGSNADKNAGEIKQDKAALENDASHATVKVPGFSASSSGAITKDDPNRQEGAWNQTIGSGKEFVGGIVGAEVSFPSPFVLSPCGLQNDVLPQGITY